MDPAQKRLHLVTTKGATDHVPVSESQLNKLRVTGGGPEYIKLGRSVFYEIEALESWVEKHRRASTSDQGADPTAERAFHIRTDPPQVVPPRKNPPDKPDRETGQSSRDEAGPKPADVIAPSTETAADGRSTGRGNDHRRHKRLAVQRPGSGRGQA